MGTSYDIPAQCGAGHQPGPGRALLRLHHRAHAARRWTRSAASPLSPIIWPTITKWAAPCARQGYTLAIPAMGVGHTAAEDSAAELFRHELRWTRTIRTGQSGRAIWAASSPMASPSP